MRLRKRVLLIMSCVWLVRVRKADFCDTLVVLQVGSSWGCERRNHFEDTTTQPLHCRGLLRQFIRTGMDRAFC